MILTLKQCWWWSDCDWGAAVSWLWLYGGSRRMVTSQMKISKRRKGPNRCSPFARWAQVTSSQVSFYFHFSHRWVIQYIVKRNNASSGPWCYIGDYTKLQKYMCSTYKNKTGLHKVHMCKHAQVHQGNCMHFLNISHHPPSCSSPLAHPPWSSPLSPVSLI